MNNLPVVEYRRRIFLSSTDDMEVRKYRQAAKQIIESEEFRDKWVVSEMGGFPPDASNALKMCEDQVLSCSVYVGLFGPFYGTVNEEVNRSYTEYEYIVASSAQPERQIGIFLLPDSILTTASPDDIISRATTLQRQQEFKELVKGKHTIKSVVDLEDFKTQLVRYLRSLDNKKLPSPFPTSHDDPSLSILYTSVPQTFQGRSYKDFRDAFRDMDRLNRYLIEEQLQEGAAEPRLDLKLIAVGMTFSWDDVITTRIPDLLRDYKTLLIRLEILFVDQGRLSEALLATHPINWVTKSRQKEEEAREYVAALDTDIQDRISFEARTYKNLPHWHGWLVNEEYLFLGRTSWDFTNGNAKLLVGQSKYRYFDKSVEEGRERVELFLKWHHYYWNFSSDLVASNNHRYW